VFELSCADYTFYVLPHEKALRLIADLDIPYIDILVYPSGNHISSESVLADPTGQGKLARERADQAGLGIADVIGLVGSYTQQAPNDPDPAVRKQSRESFMKMVEFANECGSHSITVVPGIEWPGESRASALARSGEELGWRAAYAEDHHLRLCYEPHVESITESVADARHLVELAPGLRITLDYSHLVYLGIPLDEIATLHPLVGHVHLRQGAKGVMQASSRTGIVDYAAVIDSLRSLEYDGFFCAEYCCDPYADMDRIDTVTETVRMRDLFLGVRDGTAGAVPEPTSLGQI
jgi:sugar phosphate isomerase/epimerase